MPRRPDGNTDFTGNDLGADMALSADNASSVLVSRNVTIDGHRTSIRLEPFMWDALLEICKNERMTIHKLCSMIAARKQLGGSLTAAIRVFIMAYFRAAATPEGHEMAHHGQGHPFQRTPFDLSESRDHRPSPPSLPPPPMVESARAPGIAAPRAAAERVAVKV